MGIFEIIRIVLSWQNLLAMMGGTLCGLIVGLLPGIGPAIGMALTFPLALKWPTISALIFMVSLYHSSTFGGSVTAIMLNTPGDSANAATILDGYPMSEKGLSGVALGLSAMSAVVGGITGVIVLILFSPRLAKLALAFGPAEYFLVAVFALSIIASVIKGDTIMGLISAGLGLMLSTVGYDLIFGDLRFTFGLPFLEDGVPFVPTLVGLFAVSQALLLSETTLSISREGKLAGSVWEGCKTYFRYSVVAIRSAFIGLWIGILPAIGQSAAGLVAYADAMRTSKHPEAFGKGEPAGVIASETATNACMPGSLVCTLALGIPGSIGAAIFLSIMISFGVIPGPLVFVEHADVVNSLFLSLILTQIFILILGLAIVRYVARLSLIPNEIIVPAILAVCLLGSFAVRYMVADVILTVGFGIVGFILKKAGFNLIPLILGLVLGKMVETNFQQSLIISGGSYSIFFHSFVSKILVALIVFSLVSPIIGPPLKTACRALWRRSVHIFG